MPWSLTPESQKWGGGKEERKDTRKEKEKKEKERKEMKWGIKEMSVILYLWKSLHRMWVCMLIMERSRTMASHFFALL